MHTLVAWAFVLAAIPLLAGAVEAVWRWALALNVKRTATLPGPSPAGLKQRP